MIRKRICGLLGLLLLWGASASAQQSPKEVAHSTNGWLLIMNEYRFSPKWYLSTELHLRRADLVKDWQQYILRPALNYRLHPNLDVALGYSHMKTYPYGDQPVRTIIPENQLWQHLLLRHGLGKAGLTHRYRLEQRWIGSTVPNSEGGWDISGTDYAQRFRYRIFARLPLFTPAARPQQQLFAAFWDEVFLNLDTDFLVRNLQQNRIYLGLGYQFSPMANVQAGYMSQLIRKPNGIQYEQNPTLNVSLFYNLDLYRKPSEPTGSTSKPAQTRRLTSFRR
ncbi:DUF2490 domain-containing protein [Cesiribacter andamanensis]|uniref:DUF2490 domain-containing protein n=1 Tax=Cesiribacter andamanensis AMV16 TaxID=1279009 RepID=M7NBC7_9BACT|nr:DUF2490 domain-containing protein [Cesiribacter andamanensis]EMR04506.1 hypothetical protein ADICEAN_00406 [Cesiribacter andamanensis AMV16]